MLWFPRPRSMDLPTSLLSHSALSMLLSSSVFSSGSKTDTASAAKSLSVYFTGIENAYDLQRLRPYPWLAALEKFPDRTAGGPD